MKTVFALAGAGMLAWGAAAAGQSPIPVVAESGIPLLVPVDELRPVNPPVFGPDVRISPAHRLAILEADRPLRANDPLVGEAASRLSRMTAQYLDDAPGIAELAAQTVKAVRASKRSANPFEILDGALEWKGAARLGQNYPRQFDVYMTLYRRLRVEEKKDHAETLAIMQRRPKPKPAK